MKKVRYIAGLAGLAPAAAGVMTGTAAHAAQAGGSAGHDASALAKTAKTVSLHYPTARTVTADPVFSCFNAKSGYYGWCNAPIIHGPTELISGLGASVLTLRDGNRVKVTCWYRNNLGLIQDHVVREHVGNTYYYIVGHVSDYNVNFSGLYPYSLPLRHC
jgi:hypothetical protein